MDPRIKQLRNVLDELASADRADNDTKEIVYDRELAKVRSLERSGIIEIVRQAVGENKKRRRFAPSCFRSSSMSPVSISFFGSFWRSPMQTADPTLFRRLVSAECEVWSVS